MNIQRNSIFMVTGSITSDTHHEVQVLGLRM